MATDSGYGKRDFLRVCDICGHRFHFSQLKPIGELKFACPDDAPGLTALQISRYNARARPLVVRPNKHAKLISQTPIYQFADAAIFNFISTVAPAGEQDGTNEVAAAAWATIYMADVLAQDKRPQVWEPTARATITRCCTYLLTRQYGSLTGLTPAGTADNPRYGGLTDDLVTWDTANAIAAGVAFLKAYVQLGVPAYLDAAERVATFIRHAQSGNVQATAYTVYPSAGGRYYLGGLASAVSEATGLLSNAYRVAEVGALWFLRLLADVKGETTAYGDAVATAFFGVNRVTLATMMSDLATFATVGPRDSTTGELTPGLSATAPKTVYGAATSAGAGAAKWDSGDTVASDDVALALLGLHAVNGTTALETELLEWLQGFASNVANRTPADMPESRVLAGITGTYDAVLCPADFLKSAAPFTEADDALYSWSSLGLLSPMLALATLRRSKDQLDKRQRYSALDNYELYLGPIGSSGLSFQPIHRGSDGGLVGIPGSGAGTGGAAATPPSEGLVFWVKGDAGVQSTGGLVTGWLDQGVLGQHLTASNVGHEPTIGTDSLNGVPGIVFPVAATNPPDPTLTKFLGRFTNLKASDGQDFGVGVGQHKARTVFAVVRPRMFASNTIMVTGGPLFSFRQASAGTFSCFVGLLWLQAYFDSFRPSFFVYSNEGGPYGLTQVRGPDTLGTVYENQAILVEFRADYPSLAVAINGGADLTLTPSSLAGISTDGAGPASDGFIVGNGAPLNTPNWQGSLFEMLIWDRVLTGQSRTAALSYIAARYASVDLAFNFPSSIVRAAKTGMVYRQAPGHYPQLRGN